MKARFMCPLLAWWRCWFLHTAWEWKLEGASVLSAYKRNHHFEVEQWLFALVWQHIVIIVSNGIIRSLVSPDHFVLGQRWGFLWAPAPLKFKSADQPLWDKLFDLLVNDLILPPRKFSLQHPIYWKYTSHSHFIPSTAVAQCKVIVGQWFWPTGTGSLQSSAKLLPQKYIVILSRPKSVRLLPGRANEWEVQLSGEEWFLLMEETDILQWQGAAKSQQNNNKKKQCAFFNSKP